MVFKFLVTSSFRDVWLNILLGNYRGSQTCVETKTIKCYALPLPDKIPHGILLLIVQHLLGFHISRHESENSKT